MSSRKYNPVFSFKMNNTINNIRAVSLTEILDARERRSNLQKRLIEQYGSTVISFTMNIAGPVKNSPLIERAFYHGLSLLISRLDKSKILFEYSLTEAQGCAAFIAVDMPTDTVKSICVDIEESSRLGRLFDMDVIDENGNKLERKNVRACIVCGKPGRECAAGRLHNVATIADITANIITEHFSALDSQKLGSMAVKSLIQEVETTPKPGLVDLRNNGSHKDMDVNTFRKSADSLESYFVECVRIGIKTKNNSHAETFKQLRSIGIEAEKTMYRATGGINTHKGAIYSMGVLLGAIGRSWTPDVPVSKIGTIVAEAALLVQDSTIADFNSANGKTAGERLFIEHGIKGIRGEVASGFPSVINYSLPTYENAISNGLAPNDAGVLSLLKLISTIDDTNIYHRGGADGSCYAKEYASRLFDRELDLTAVEEMDDEFIKRNLSPGGAADLLAITYFLYKIKNFK